MSVYSENRSELYRVIKTEFRINGKVLSENEWYNLFFKSSSTFSESKPTNNNNKITYNNLFDILNNKKHSYLVGGNRYETTNETIVDYYYGGTDEIDIGWKKTLTDKNEFYKYLACDLDWAKQTTYCGGIAPTVTPAPNNGYNPANYVGKYKDTTTTIVYEVTKNADNVNLDIKLHGFKALLTHTTNDDFVASATVLSTAIKCDIKFKRDGNNVTGFHYKFDAATIPAYVTTYLGNDFKAEGDAEKYESKLSDKTEKFFADKDKWAYFQGNSSSPYGNNKQDAKIKNKNTQKNSATLKNEPFKISMPKNIHPCDENAAEWEVGCQNEKIRAINKKLLNKDSDVLTDYLIKSLSNDDLIKRGAATVPKFIYDQIMALNEKEQDKFNLKRFKKLINKKL